MAITFQTLAPSCVRQGTQDRRRQQQQLACARRRRRARPSPRRSRGRRSAPAASRAATTTSSSCCDSVSVARAAAGAAARRCGALRAGLAVAAAAMARGCWRAAAWVQRDRASAVPRAQRAVPRPWRASCVRTGTATAQTAMLYHAYQAQADALWPLRAWARACRAAARHRPLRRRRRPHAPAGRRLRGDRPGRGHAPAARLGHRQRRGRRRAGAGASRRRCCARRSPRCCAFAKAGAPRAAQGAGGGADVGPLRHAAARHRAHDAARPRRLRHRLAQRARRAAGGRPLRPRRVHRAPDATSWRAIGPGAHVVAICQPCVAALAATALMSEDDAPGHAGQPDADGRPDRLPRQPDRGQQAGHRASRSSGSRSNLISHVPLAPCAAPGRRVYPGFVQLTRLHEHEPRAPRRTRSATTTGTWSTTNTRRPSRSRALLRGVLRGGRPAGRVLPRDRAAGVPGATRCRAAS